MEIFMKTYLKKNPHEDEYIVIHYDENGDFSLPDLDSLIPNEDPF